MRKLAAVSTTCLVIITLILVHREWSEYRRAREAEADMARFEQIKPARYRSLPDPESGVDSTPEQRIVVSVDEKGGLKLGEEEAGTLADLGPLKTRLEHALSARGGERPDRTVIVKAPQSLKYSEISRLIEAVKQAGAQPVGLETEYSR